jgi:hypothetical protein
MRLWTLHPRYLDTKGLIAVWREALLAQKVLAGATKGYRNHPQLLRFRAHLEPMSAIANFLTALNTEATARGYHFDATKIQSRPCLQTIEETLGQILYEWAHLKNKLQTRAPQRANQIQKLTRPQPHPFFRIIPGDIQVWENNNSKATPSSRHQNTVGIDVRRF